MNEQAPPLTLEQYRHLHLLTEHVGRDVLGDYWAKYEEVRDGWARIFPPGKALPPGKDLSDAERRARLLYSGDGSGNSQAPRTDWHDFQRRWQGGSASLAELKRQVKRLNEVLSERKEGTIAELHAESEVASAADRLAGLEAEMPELRGAIVNLRSAVADLERRLSA